MLSGFMILLGGLSWLAALHQSLTRDVEAPLRWSASWGVWALRGSVFTLAGLGGFAPGLWKLPFLAGALAMMTVSAFIDQAWKRRAGALVSLNS
jgi:hypothetical protein